MLFPLTNIQKITLMRLHYTATSSANCENGFFAASWKRPQAYLDPKFVPPLHRLLTLKTLKAV